MKKLTDAQIVRKLDRLLPLHALWCPKGKNRLRFLTLALCGEAGELANLIKKEWRGDKLDKAAHRQKVVDEICDVYVYTGIIARVLGIRIHQEALRKTLEVEARPAFKKALARLRGSRVRARQRFRAGRKP